MHLKTAIKSLPLCIAALSLPTLASASPFDAKQMGIGGASVTAGDFTRSIANPALASDHRKGHLGNRFHLSFNGGLEVSDRDDLIEGAEDVADLIDEIDQRIQEGSASVLVDAQELTDELENLQGRTLLLKTGAGAQLAIPHDYIGGSVFANTELRAGLDFIYDPQDEQRIIDNIIADETMDNLESSVRATGVMVTDIGMTLSHTYTMDRAVPDLGFGAIPAGKLRVGISPKLQQIGVIDYNEAIAGFDDAEFDANEDIVTENGFNIDFGAVQYLGADHQYRAGAMIRNVIPRTVESERGNEFNMRPLASVGLGYNNGWLSVDSEVDLNERQGFQGVDDVQYARIGMEINAWHTLQLRMGYRNAINGGDDNVVTAGLGFSPFNIINVDVSALAGENETYGASVQLGMGF